YDKHVGHVERIARRQPTLAQINSRAKLMDDGLVDRACWAPKPYSVRERNASE
ncbi:hypothetical protein LTS16_026983, partial [Friedmanniomyces endolithicus]